MSFKQEFSSYILECFKANRLVQLQDVIKENYIIEDTNDITSLSDLKRMWLGRLKKSYEISIEEFKSDHYPNIDLMVNEDIWTSIYTKVVKRQDRRNQTIASADRGITTSTLYRQANDRYRDDLLGESSSHNKKQKFNDLYDDVVPRVISDTNVSNEDFRTEVFKAGYNMLKHNLSLSTIRDLNSMADAVTPVTFGEHLDHFAHHLLGKNKAKEVEAALKLSLSRIIYMVGGSVYNAQKLYFKEQNLNHLLEEAVSSKPILVPGLSTDMIAVYVEFLDKVGVSLTEARKFLMERRLDLLVNGVEDSDMMKMLDVLDYMVSTFLPLPISKASELTWYRKLAHILDILFRKSGISLKDDELCCDATKVARNENRLLCEDEDDKKTLLGRKIDLLLNAVCLDMSSSEWKKDGVAVSLGEQQQIKNVRTNSAILKQLLKLSIDPDKMSNCYVLAMDWIGVCGYLFTVKKFNDVHVAHHVGDLFLPASSSSFRDFQATLDLLFSFRNHHMNLRKIIEPAQQRQSALNTLRSYRNVTPPSNEPSVPGTFFTPVKKQTKANHDTDE